MSDEDGFIRLTQFFIAFFIFLSEGVSFLHVNISSILNYLNLNANINKYLVSNRSAKLEIKKLCNFYLL